KKASEMLENVRLPDPKRIMNSYPHQLSGGQQQRVLIAMALLSNPKLLLLDEPTTALDVTVEAGIVELIKEISEKLGTSMIYISHNLGLILETCDRITVMYSGQAVELGSVKQVFDMMRHPYTRGLFASIPLPGADRFSHPLVPIRGQLPLPHERPQGCYFGPRCDFFQAGKCDEPDLHMQPVKGHPGHDVRCARYSEIDWEHWKPEGVTQDPLEKGDVVLQVQNMQKYYEVHDNSLKAIFSGERVKYVKANEKLDFEAHEAETVAIVGESGCGKTTFAKVLMGLESATGGHVILNGLDISELPVRERDPHLVSNLQIVFQNPFETLNPSHSVGGQIARVLKKFGIAETKEELQQKVFELLDIVKLPRDFAYRKPRQLSGGQKQRIGIARAFGGDPSVVIADEPVSALDVSVQAAVTGLLTDIQREKRTTMLFISHDLSVVRYLADRIVVMYLGQIMEQGTTDEIFSPPYHPYTEALLSAVPIADTSIDKKHIVLTGELPSPMNPPSGCPFQTRCQRKIGDICETVHPPVKELSSGHRIMCHLSEEEFEAMEPIIVQAKKKRNKSDDAQKVKFVARQKKTQSAKPNIVVKQVGKAEAKKASFAKVRVTVSPATPAEKKPAEEAKPKRKPAARKSGPTKPRLIKKPRRGKADDLKDISGVGPKLENTLNELGVWHFDQIASWGAMEISWVDDHLNFKGRIKRDKWVAQAKKLAKKK
ncbi:MAG: dipeptide ABC transporter ATP-binding protein, partial [Hyphomicrobiales bacterium]